MSQVSTQVQVVQEARSLWFGAPGSDDSQRSQDEIRIIKDMAREEVELFLQINNIDTAAARELRNEPVHVQLAVLERGPLRACVNPSGALVARIRDAKRGVLGSGGNKYGGGLPPSMATDPNANEVDKFLAAHSVDQAAVAALRSEPPDVQKAVLAKGPLVNTTNPSASLMARIRNVKTDVQGLAARIAASTTPNPPPPPMSLEGANGNHLNDEALKAIQKLTANMARSNQSQTAPPPAMPPAPPSAPTPAAPAKLADNGGSSQMLGVDDKRLQDEAMRAIQALNAAQA
mmetsp:Transcript_70485/g.168810  ORF Transcript_70485/g.168810 Transcript_70485/m.168810 type:complete len:289 (-) Transcript_70485:119-985(-)